MATAAQNKKKSIGNKLPASDDLLLTILNQIQADIRKLDGKIDDNIRELKADNRKLDGKIDDNIRELNNKIDRNFSLDTWYNDHRFYWRHLNYSF